MIYLQLFGLALIPIALSILFYMLEDRTDFRKLPYWSRQVIIGIAFGAAAIFGTECGIPFQGVQINARDAAPLCAGLIYGGPAGIIAGAIGGVERWLAVYWGVGEFSRVSCSVATILAGLYGAFLRKFMFDNRKPTPLIALFSGIVLETLHMMLLLLTRFDSPDMAFDVIQKCTLPMVCVNAVAVFLAVFFIYCLSKEQRHVATNSITYKVQIRLLLAVVLGYLITSAFTLLVQWGIANNEVNQELKVCLEDVQKDIQVTSDENLLGVTRRIARQVNIGDNYLQLDYQMMTNEVSVINLVDHTGTIVQSTCKDYIGFDMGSGEQSVVFNCLLDGTEEYVQDYQPITFDNSSYKYAGVAIEGGYVQVGYNASRFQKNMRKSVEEMTAHRHINRTGFMAVLDAQENVISGSEDEEINKLLETELAKSIPEDATKEFTRYPLTIGDEEFFGMYTVCEDYNIIALEPRQEALRNIMVSLYVASFIEILIFAVLFGVIYLIIKNLVVRNIRSVNYSLSQITGGNLNEKVDVRDTSEFAALSDDINATVDTLKGYIAEAAARIDQELEVARKIQASSLPGRFIPDPERGNLDLYPFMCTAKEVGGDFYDYYWLDDHRLAAMVSDVSGKGIPAAMFMMTSKTMIKNIAESGEDLANVYMMANDHLCEGNDAGMFVTSWMYILDTETGHMEFVNAGHNPPVIRRPGGEFEYLKSRPGLVLAGMEGVPYRKQEMDIEPGTVLYLYTDGVTEATDSKNELFGEDRLLESLNRHSGKTMEQLCLGVKADVDAFVGEAPQFDDITMMAMIYEGPAKKNSEEYCSEEENVSEAHCSDMNQSEDTEAVMWGMEPEEITVYAKIENIPMLQEWMDARLEKLECSFKAQTQLDIAVDEIFCNIASYAYGEEGGTGTMKMETTEDPDRTVLLTFVDQGIPFDPLKSEEPDTTLSAEERGIGGLGIFMVKKSMDDMRYEYKDGCNILTLVKKI